MHQDFVLKANPTLQQWKAIVRFRDRLLAEGHDLKSIGIAMTSIGAGALCGVRETAVYPVPEGAKPPSGI